MNRVSYPLRATCISIDIKPFGFWPVPEFSYRKNLTERAKAEGATIWWFRWAWFQLSCSRFL